MPRLGGGGKSVQVAPGQSREYAIEWWGTVEIENHDQDFRPEILIRYPPPIRAMLGLGKATLRQYAEFPTPVPCAPPPPPALPMSLTVTVITRLEFVKVVRQTRISVRVIARILSVVVPIRSRPVTDGIAPER
jgi:hypothetical protein